MPEYFNTTNEPVVYNDNGQIVGGAEWFTSEETNQVKRALDEGVFIAKTEVSGKNNKKQS